MIRSQILATLLFIAGTASADVSCRSELSIKWQRAESTNKAPKAAQVEEGANTAESAAQEISEIWGIVEKSGLDEASAKASLAELVARERVKAMELCRKKHENLAGCVAAKYAALGGTLQSLDFGARKSLDRAIHADCQAAQGRCLEVVTGTETCVDSVAVADAGKGDKKEDKKDEKKK